MVMERLREYAERRLSLPPPMYQEQPIRYILDLDRDGRPLGPPIDTANANDKAASRGGRRLAPHVKRASSIKPKLLADTGVYALGLPTEKDRPERVPQQQAAFAALVAQCAAATNEPAVAAVAEFLRGLPERLPSLPDDFDPGATLTFRVDGSLPIDLPAVRAFWADFNGAGEADESEAAGGAGDLMECIGCGQMRSALRRHPLKIKGIPGGQMSGMDLISANAAAFESYGLANSLIAPTCQSCAEAYGNALNALLAGEETSFRVGETASVFWTLVPTGFRPKRVLSAPEPEEVRELIAAAQTGRAAAADIDPAAFYALGLSASGSRVVVRSWIDTTVGEAKRRLGRWFMLQALVEPDGEEGRPLPAWRLANATTRDPRKDPPAERVVEGLIGLALGGTPPPLELLFAAVRRCRAEQGVTRERAALIKLVLGAHPELTGGREVSEQLDLDNGNPAYLCGRLLAVLDAIQRRALNNPNATIVDKFYGTAASAPASVFGTLLHGARPHLAKLRKDRSTEAAAHALERRLEDVLAPLAAFPKTLTLPEQGLFALGFYHQRAADRRAARERRAERERGEHGEANAATEDDSDE